MEITIECYQERYFIKAGERFLSTGFKSEELARGALKSKRSFYEYWVNSISAIPENVDDSFEKT